jgi:hypothetical protein
MIGRKEDNNYDPLEEDHLAFQFVNRPGNIRPITFPQLSGQKIFPGIIFLDTGIEFGIFLVHPILRHSANCDLQFWDDWTPGLGTMDFGLSKSPAAYQRRFGVTH